MFYKKYMMVLERAIEVGNRAHIGFVFAYIPLIKLEILEELKVGHRKAEYQLR